MEKLASKLAGIKTVAIADMYVRMAIVLVLVWDYTCI